MRRALTTALLATSMFSLPGMAHAQAMTAEEAAALRAELATLKAQVQMLEARLDAATAEPAPAPLPTPTRRSKPKAGTKAARSVKLVNKSLVTSSSEVKCLTCPIVTDHGPLP